MGKLNQVIAVVAGKKTRAAAVITETYHKIQKAGLMDGISRTYQPKDEEGEKLPSESKIIQVTSGQLINEVSAACIDMIDAVATQDYANCQAKAGVEVNGYVLLKDVPVTHLLFLEKQLTDLGTFIGKLPTLDPAEEWSYNQDTDSYSSKPAETTKTKKIPKAFVAYEATDKHPAQVQVFHEDVLAGYWKTIKFSGALPAKDKNAMLDRVRQLKEAVIKARESANNMEVQMIKEGEAIFNFVFKGK